jgi:hypothetical protein
MDSVLPHPIIEIGEGKGGRENVEGVSTQDIAFEGGGQIVSGCERRR